MNLSDIVNVADSQPHDSYRAANGKFVNITVSDNNAFMKTQYEKCVSDQLKHKVSNVAMKNDLAYIINQTGQLSDEDDVDGKDFVNNHFRKRVKPFDFQTDNFKAYYSGRIGVNMYQAAKSEYTVVF